MALFGAALVRRAEADGGAAGDQRWPVGFLCRLDRGGNRRGIVAVDAGRGPAGRLEALDLVDVIRQRGRSVDRNAVVVVEHDELAQLQMSAERDRLLADAFHQVAVGGQHISGVIDDGVAEDRGEMALGDRHADGIGEALAERAGGGLDAGRMAVLGMAGGERAELAEALDLLDRHRLVAEQIKQRIEQHRAVAGGEHEAVAVGPRRIGRIELEKLGEQHGGDIGRAHRQAGMAGLGLFDGIHRQRADGIGHAVVRGARERSGGRRRVRIHGARKAGGLGERSARRGETVRLGHRKSQSRRKGFAAVIETVLGTGRAQITWRARQSIPRRWPLRVMHRSQSAPLTLSRDTT